MSTRALGAFSGGLDSMLSAAVLRGQDIDVHLVTFSSPFFSPEKATAVAEQLGLPIRVCDYTEVILRLVKDPPSGLGRNCNPCIDCHAGMFREMGRIAAEEDFDLIFSGEVLGQRPMSQNRGSLRRVARLSGHPEILLRPLSARLLEETGPEKARLVDRNRLLDISGRSRKRQMRMAAERGLDYEPPGGGCILTDPGYSMRLRELMDLPEQFYSGPFARIIRYGRMFRLSPLSLGLVGRSEEDNGMLEGGAGDLPVLELAHRPGPTAVLVGDRADIPMLARLVALYGRVPEGEPAEVTVRGDASLSVRSLPRHHAENIQVRL